MPETDNLFVIYALYFKLFSSAVLNEILPKGYSDIYIRNMVIFSDVVDILLNTNNLNAKLIEGLDSDTMRISSCYVLHYHLGGLLIVFILSHGFSLFSLLVSKCYYLLFFFTGFWFEYG